MKLKAFKITNFRSIVDTGFQDLSPDGISLIVGQNESGKSSVLDGIHAFETGEISEDDTRSDGSSPEITCIFQFESFAELSDCVPEGQVLPKGFKKTFEKLGKNISLTRFWEEDHNDSTLQLENEELANLWADDDESMASLEGAPPQPTAVAEPLFTVIAQDDFVGEVFSTLPQITMFEEDSLLPGMIDLDALIQKDQKVAGYEGARNFLLIAGITAEELQSASNTRIVEDKA